MTMTIKNKTIKSIATGVAAVGAIGAAAIGVASVASAQGLPNPQQLSVLCAQATDPNVPAAAKNNLVENGINPTEARDADHDLHKAARDGKFPQTFTVTNIAPAGPNAAQADVAIAGPKLAGPVTKHLMFIDQGGNWVLQHDSAFALLQAATS
ncbi:hypothetical protein [Mycobacterium sp.]|uniref:hypothetical protein n=1 Tax=Mycobacterium sp. TaxID=1785 RepID=UPI0039C96927